MSETPDTRTSGPPREAHEPWEAMSSRSRLGPTVPLLISLGLLGAGSTLVASLIGLEMSRQDFPEWTLGLIAAGFATGGIVGANIAPRVVARIGHIHTFAALAVMLGCVVLAHGLTASPALWLVLRLTTGILYYGLLLIGESWLNGVADDRSRGRILALYMVVFLGSAATGQLLLNLTPALADDAFIVAGMILVLCVVPITLLGHAAADEESHRAMPFRSLLSKRPLPLFGAFCAGVIVGTYYGLGAVYADQRGFTTADTSLFLATIIGGALVLQWPIGRLSDRVQRRYVISGAAAVTAAGAFGIAITEYFAALLGIAFLFGGAAFSLYSLNLAQAGDRVRSSETIGLSRGFLTAFALGSAAGPLAAGSLVAVAGASVIFLLPAAFAVVLAAAAVFGSILPRVAERLFVSVPTGSLASSSLDPRQDSAGAERAGAAGGTDHVPGRGVTAGSAIDGVRTHHEAPRTASRARWSSVNFR